MKSVILALLLVVSSTAFAQTCKIVTPYAAGGPADEFVRAMQRVNPDIDVIQYRPGAFGSRGIEHMRTSPEYMMAAAPLMWTSKNPDKSPRVQLLKVVLLYGQMAVSGNGTTMADVLSKPVNIAMPNIGGSQHLLALELKKVNPQINIIPIPGAAAGLQAVVNKEVDVYITPSKAGRNMVQNFGANIVFEIPYNKQSMVINGVTLTNYGMFGLFIHDNATVAQQLAARRCVEAIVTSEAFSVELKKLESGVFKSTRSEEQQYIKRYLAELDKNAF